MRRLTFMLIVATALPMLVACHSDAPPAPQAPATPTEARAEPPPAPEPAAAPEEAPAPDSPGITIAVTLGDFNAHAFSNFTTCSVAALTLTGDQVRCRSNCECMGVHHGPDSQEHCLLSCSAD